MAVLAVGALLAFEPVQDAWHQVRAERAWPVDQARTMAVVDAIQLPDAYTPTNCADDLGPAGTKCWVVTAPPEDAFADLQRAVATIGAEVVLTDCSGPTTPEGSAGCAISAQVSGTYDPQGLALTVIRDIDAEAVSRDDVWLETSTVRLVPALTTP